MAQLDPLPEFSDISLSEISPDRVSLQSRTSTSFSLSSPSQAKSKTPKKPSFNYDYDLFKLCQKYLSEKNHHGLALIARQKGLPPFLRFKIWPVLLKYHPYVLKPSIQPDSRTADAKDDIKDDELKARIKKDLNKYLIRLKYSKKGHSLDTSESIRECDEQAEDSVEMKIFDILENSILKFIVKWGKIIKYDSALTWIALGLAEWFPPINKTSWVLVGRDLSSTHNNSIKDLFVDYSNYIDNIPNLSGYLKDLINDESISNLSFHEVYERLVLVLLHCPSNKLKANQSINDKISLEKLSNLPVNGGSIEERVTLFIYIFRKLLPELSDYFSEEQILNKFGSNDDEWLIWWLKYCGSKVWSRLDRGKIWDLLIGFKFKSPGKNYNDTLQLDSNILNKLGNNDNFWSLGFDNNNNSSMDLSSLQFEPEPETLNTVDIPFPVIDPHIQLIFITLALLKSKENTLIELDQHEIRQYLSRLPTNSYNLTNKYQIFRQKIDKKREEESVKSVSRSSRSSRSSTIVDNIPSTPNTSTTANTPTTMPLASILTPGPAPITTENLATADTSVSPHDSVSPHTESNIITNDSVDNHTIDFMDNIIAEAGELWRKWLWSENQ